MNYQQMIKTMTPEQFRSLRCAVELGKWPDGQKLTAEQKQHAMQAVIAWGEQHLPEDERVGYLDRGHKAGESCDDPGATTLNWK